jgi:hypothetical protein
LTFDWQAAETSASNTTKNVIRCFIVLYVRSPISAFIGAMRALEAIKFAAIIAGDNSSASID